MNSLQKWIYQPRGLSMAARILLPYYCARANGELACFPSYSRTGRDCELSRRSVIRGTEELCLIGLLKVVTDPVERAAILAAAGTNYNLRVNVYRISYSKSAQDGEAATPSDSEAATPPRPNGEAATPSYGNLEAKALAMCVPIDPEDGEAATPSTNPEVQENNRRSVKQMRVDGEAATPRMVKQLPVDGEAATPKLLNELKESELQAGAEAPAGAPVVVRSHPSGAPSSARATEPKDDEGLPERGTTIGGALAKAPVLGGSGAAPPAANALRQPGTPPDPFADWLDAGAPAARALGLTIARPKPIYAPPDELKAARQRLAARAAARAGP